MNMKKMKKASDIRIGIIGSSFRGRITDELQRRCVRRLRAKGVLERNIIVMRVPGALEIPLIAKKMAAAKRYNALIALGVVLKGKTYHFEQVANECARGCMDVSRAYDIPVIYEVLAVYRLKDALARATRARENKGVEAADSALAMIETLSEL